CTSSRKTATEVPIKNVATIEVQDPFFIESTESGKSTSFPFIGRVSRRYLSPGVGCDQRLPPGYPRRMPRHGRSHSIVGKAVGNKMHKAFPLPGESSYWQYKFPLPVNVVPTARILEMPLPGVCTAIEEMMKKLPTKSYEGVLPKMRRHKSFENVTEAHQEGIMVFPLPQGKSSKPNSTVQTSFAMDEDWSERAMPVNEPATSP
nr:hypothetical protein [Tanacetum cinerariifolium]